MTLYSQTFLLAASYRYGNTQKYSTAIEVAAIDGTYRFSNIFWEALLLGRVVTQKKALQPCYTLYLPSGISATTGEDAAAITPAKNKQSQYTPEPE